MYVHVSLSPPPLPPHPPNPSQPSLSSVLSYMSTPLLLTVFHLYLSLFHLISDHCFIHKWLLLTDPDDPSAGAKGYLKFSINVIGPGEDPTPSPSTMSQESVDIES